MDVVTIYFTITDAKGKSSRTELKVPTGYTLPEYIEFAESAAQIIANCILGQITQITISFDVSMVGTSIKSIANNVADIAQKMFFLIRNTAAQLSRLKIPTMNEQLVLANSDLIDRSDADVAALETALESGLLVTSGATVLFASNTGLPIGQTEQVREYFRGTGLST